MFANRLGISENLDIRSVGLKKPAVVIAIARSVNGSIFARSFDRSSLR